jgi:hypothetical protein
MVKSNQQDAETLAAIAELGEAHCELNHGLKNTEKFDAVEVLIIPMGRQVGEIEYEETHKFYIPICKECAEALTSDEWTLIYCLECTASQWIHRPSARLNYRHHILWVKGCIKCTNQFGGLYFADVENFPNSPSEDL